MNGAGAGFPDDIQNTLFAIARFTARLFRRGMPSGCTHTANAVCRPGGWRCLGRDKYRLSAGYGGNPRPVNRYNVRYKGGWWIYLLLAEFNVLLHPVRKLNVVSFVDGVGFAFLREAHPFPHRQKTPSEGS